MDKGLIHIYTGDGKGKTSAALGVIMRAYGVGYNILFAQFLKGQDTGELTTLKTLGIDVLRTESVKKFIPDMNESEKKSCANAHKICYNNVKRLVSEKDYDMLILDEVIPAINLGLIDLTDFLNFLQNKPLHTEVILTGRDAPKALMQMADYITDMHCIAHPYNDKGLPARKGIEY
ncbi:MAG: cob(I)yrinic acid a,c-diamide adenosyltransferase [Oscillospiraceae bacterium]